ncbi:hypothetical protein KKD70_02810 [Patescibacteria group bacterium]|nr:hypothetical protein [Patescibacteria group bacterium]
MSSIDKSSENHKLGQELDQIPPKNNKILELIKTIGEKIYKQISESADEIAKYQRPPIG